MSKGRQSTSKTSGSHVCRNSLRVCACFAVFNIDLHYTCVYTCMCMQIDVENINSVYTLGAAHMRLSRIQTQNKHVVVSCYYGDFSAFS